MLQATCEGLRHQSKGLVAWYRKGGGGAQVQTDHPEKNLRSVPQRQVQDSFLTLARLQQNNNSRSAAETDRHNQKCGPLTPAPTRPLTKMSAPAA